MEYVVRKEKIEALEQKLRELGVKKTDIEEKFVRSGGHGGQNVNKTATCVQLRHLPTQILVKCQKSRSQPLNRFLALRLLAEKIEAQQKKAAWLERKRAEETLDME